MSIGLALAGTQRTTEILSPINQSYINLTRNKTGWSNTDTTVVINFTV